MIKVIILTLIIYWCIGIIISQINEDWLAYWAVGLVYPILYVLLYPVRAIKRYNSSCNYYKKHNITRMQYLFGKRVE